MQYAWMPAVLLALASRAVASQTITVPGNPSALIVTAAVIGAQPTPVSSSTNYSITTPNPAGRTYKVTAQLTAALPAGVSIVATATAPAGASSAGAITLSTTAQDLVTNLSRSLNYTGTITYQLVATVAAGVVSSQTRNVTLTILRFP